MADEQLQKAYQFIKDGQKVRAEVILRPLVEADADNADAWWLLANAVYEPDEIRAALRQVLRLRPDHAKAQLMLQRTNSKHPPADAEASLEDLIYADETDDMDEAVPRRVNVVKPRRGSNRTLIVVLILTGLLSLMSWQMTRKSRQ